MSKNVNEQNNNEYSPEITPPFKEENYSFFLNGVNLKLSYSEYNIFKYLYSNNNKILSSKKIHIAVYNKIPDKMYSTTVASHIKTIRAKINAISQDKEFLKTFNGSGYLLILN